MNRFTFTIALIFIFLIVLFGFDPSLLKSGHELGGFSINQVTGGYKAISHTTKAEYTSVYGSVNSNPSYPLGILQIPYTGLTLDQVSRQTADMMGLNKSSYGMIVSKVMPGSPSEEAGFQSGNITRSINGEKVKLGGDIILAIDGKVSFVRNDQEYSEYLQSKKVGDLVTFTVLRDGKIMELDLTIGVLPEFFLYEDPDEGISIKYPSDWEVIQDNLKKDEIVKFFAPDRDPINKWPAATVFLKIFPSGEFGLDTYTRHEKAIREGTRNLNVTFAELGGLPAYESIFYRYGDNDRTLKMLSAFTIKDGKQLFRINFSADPLNYDEYLPIARWMIDSFQFTS